MRNSVPVGEIIDRLEQHGIAEETLLLFTSDNGGQENDLKSEGNSLTLADESGDVALKARTAKTTARTKYGHKTNGPLRGYKGGIHEGGFRVPCIARWPAVIETGTETDALFSLVDLFATVANLVGDKRGVYGEDSIDQSTVLRGESENGPRRTTILNAPNGRLAVRSGDWKLLTTNSVKWKGDTPKLDGLPIELYDLAADPCEKNDLATSRPEMIKQLKDELITALAIGADAQTH